MTSWKFATTGNFSTTNVSSFINVFFLSFRKINVVPGDYQIDKNSNFSERVSEGPDKTSGNPRICPFNKQF